MNTKYVMSGGLAFAEEKDMEKLRALSLKGWHVRHFAFMGYKLEKGSGKDYIYSVDYRPLKEGEAGEYYDFFASSGWTHIATQGEIHLFHALPGTKPIHSDCDTVAEKHENLGHPAKWPTISLVFITILLWIGTLLSEGSVQGIFNAAAVISCIFTIPTAWTVVTIYRNKWSAERKTGLVKLAKTLPILVFLLAASVIFSNVDRFGGSISLLAYMLFGAVAFPTAIWASMFLFQKLRKKSGA